MKKFIQAGTRTSLLIMCMALASGTWSQQTIKATGTGRTTGHVASLTVTNTSTAPLVINTQTCYIPSDGKYQPYVVTIPGTTLPPGTTTIPVDGYCADVHTPPVPSGNPMPPVEEWIPVDQPGITNPEEGINLLPTPSLPAFKPEDIPRLVSSPGYTSVPPEPEAEIIITWPGTEVPTAGTIDPGEHPEDFAPLLIEALRQISAAYENLKGEGVVNTPFSGDPEKEREAVIQQTFWIYTSHITGERYQIEHFYKKVVLQFENNSGTPIDALPEEEKEKLDSGIDDFWNTYTATGVEAKVISAESPGIDPSVLATVSTPQCKCLSISYNLEVKKGNDVVHRANHTTPDHPKVSVPDFKYGDALDVKMTNIKANCNCREAECPFYPAQSTSASSSGYTKTDLTRPGKTDIEMDNDPAGEIGGKGNNNCQHKNKTFNADETEYTFRIETVDEKTNEASVFQRMRIKAYCELEDCRRSLCAKIIQINFVKAN